MKKFELVSEYLKDYKPSIANDLMYQIKGNTRIIKNIICNKILEETEEIGFNTEEIKALNVYVVKDDEGFTEIWLDFNKYKEMYLIVKVFDLEINNVDKIKNIIVNWLLG